MSTTRRRSAGSSAGLARKELILRSAAKVFAEKGFSNATTRDIADEAEMLSGSLYYYFESKEAMVEEVLILCLDELVGDYRVAVSEADSPVPALERLIERALRGLVESREQLTILQNDWHDVCSMPGISERLHEVEKIWVACIERGIDSGVLRGEFDPRMLYRTIMGAIQTVIRWFDPSGPVGIDAVIEVQTAVFLDGIRAPKG